VTEPTTTTATAEPTTTPAAPAAAAATPAPEPQAPAAAPAPVSASAARLAQSQAIVERRKAAEGTEPVASPVTPATPAPTEPAIEGPVHDPDTGKFVSHADAASRGLAPVPTATGTDADGAPPAPGETPAGAAAGKVLVKGPAVSGEGYTEIDLNEPLTQERIKLVQTWAKGGMRKAEYLDQLGALERERSDFNEFSEMLTTAPEHVLPAHLPQEAKAKVVLSLLQDAAVYDEVAGTLEEWELAPEKRERARADRLEADQRHRRDVSAKRDTRAKYARLETAVLAMIPEDVPKEDADDFFRDACIDIQQTIRNQKRIVDVTDLDSILARRLQRYGFAGTGGGGGNPRSPSNGSAPGAGDGARPGPRTATGSADPAKLRSLTTAPAGAGATAATGHSVPKDIKLGKGGTRATAEKILGLTRR
jgi:hypothetical protein